MAREHPGRAAMILRTVVLSVAAVSAVIADTPPDPSKPATRVEELRALAVKGSAGVPGLTAALKDPQAQVRASAVQFLVSAAGKDAVASIAPLTADTDESVAIAAVGALLGLGGDATLAPVRKAFASPSPRVRSQTAAYVGDARDARFVKDLGALLADSLPGVRRAAVEALRAVGAPSSFPFLMAATGDQDQAIAASAVAGLQTLKDPRALPRIAQLASSASPSIREAVARAIPGLGGVATYAAAFDRLVQDSQRSVRLGAATGLRDAPSTEAANALAKLGADADAVVRRVAVQAWREQPLPGAAAALAALARDGDENVRATAVAALGFRRATAQAAVVASLASDPSERVREAVASTLGDLGRPQDLPVLATLASDGSPGVRATAMVAAGRIGTAAGLAVAERGVGDTDLQVRLEAVRSLGTIELPEALVSLRGIAADGELPVRIAAIEQLGARRDKNAITLLRKISQDPVESLRGAARRALEAIGT